MRPTSRDVVFHELNRANAHRTLFEDDGDSAVCGGVYWNLTPCRLDKFTYRLYCDGR